MINRTKLKMTRRTMKRSAKKAYVKIKKETDFKCEFTSDMTKFHRNVENEPNSDEARDQRLDGDDVAANLHWEAAT